MCSIQQDVGGKVFSYLFGNEIQTGNVPQESENEEVNDDIKKSFLSYQESCCDGGRPSVTLKCSAVWRKMRHLTNIVNNVEYVNAVHLSIGNGYGTCIQN